MQRLSLQTWLGDDQGPVDAALARLREDNIISRIWGRDHTVWKAEPTEITNRLGWLDSPAGMAEHVTEIDALVDEVRAAGYAHALLLGMGGSSLAPEVFRRTFGVRAGYLDLTVLDSTHPGAVLAQAQRLDPARTLFIVSTKSGGTVETLSFFKYFFNRVVEGVGRDEAGSHFIAITDPGSSLAETAEKHSFRKTFLNDPKIGGRYSVLSYFGMVPAALVGVDVKTLLGRARAEVDASTSPDALGVRLGVVMGELAAAGRDKLTLILSPGIASVADWVEQLVAESTGKEGLGILPVIEHAPASPDKYADDRLFVHLRLAGDDCHDDAVAALIEIGHPVIQLELNDAYDLGAQFFLWEMATVVASWRLGINPFDQPNVESAKVQARKMVAAYRETGELPRLDVTVQDDGITVHGGAPAGTLKQAWSQFLSGVGEDADTLPRIYISLQAYLAPDPVIAAALEELAATLRDRFRVAVTVGYGPRFLHSTGQLHKGDGGNGLFVQFMAEMPEDADIPDQPGEDASSMSFGTLIRAQALGDRQALLDGHRRVLTVDLGRDIVGGIGRLAELI